MDDQILMGHRCALVLFMELIAGSEYGQEYTSLVVWAWTGQRETIRYLSAVSRSLRWFNHVHCCICGSSSTNERRIVRAPWCRTFRDFIDVNRACEVHIRHNPLLLTASAWSARIPIDIITRTFLLVVHGVRCRCVSCTYARSSGHLYE